MKRKGSTYDSEAIISPMKVLMVTGIFPPDIGGPATYVPAISTDLVKRGHKVTVVTLSDSVDHRDQSYSFRVLRIRRGIFKPWRFVLTISAIVRKGRKAQVLYVNGLYLEAVVANFFLRKPLVQKIVGDWAWERATSRGWVEDTFEEFQKRRHSLKVELLKTLRSFSARQAETVVVPSQYLARAVANWGVSKTRTTVVYNAVESSSSSPSAIPLSTRTNVITVGRLIPLKQIDHLIRGIAECAEAGLVIVGDGPERERLVSLVSDQGLRERVYFAGQKSKEETVALMAACDVLVLNSTHEGFPHVVLEAMSLGVPVVATAVGGTPELVRDGENGLLIAPHSNGALSGILSRLISSPMERQHLANGAKRTMEHFRPTAMVESIEAVLSNHTH